MYRKTEWTVENKGLKVFKGKVFCYQTRNCLLLLPDQKLFTTATRSETFTATTRPETFTATLDQKLLQLLPDQKLLLLLPDQKLVVITT